MAVPFGETSTGYRLLVSHPIPWTYKANYSVGGPAKAAILDKDGRVVVVEGQVSNVIFDMIWSVYFDLIRQEEEE